jgi:hypothetical protein
MGPTQGRRGPCDARRPPFRPRPQIQHAPAAANNTTPLPVSPRAFLLQLAILYTPKRGTLFLCTTKWVASHSPGYWRSVHSFFHEQIGGARTVARLSYARIALLHVSTATRHPGYLFVAAFIILRACVVQSKTCYAHTTFTTCPATTQACPVRHDRGECGTQNSHLPTRQSHTGSVIVPPAKRPHPVCPQQQRPWSASLVCCPQGRGCTIGPSLVQTGRRIGPHHQPCRSQLLHTPSFAFLRFRAAGGQHPAAARFRAAGCLVDHRLACARPLAGFRATCMEHACHRLRGRGWIFYEAGHWSVTWAVSAAHLRSTRPGQHEVAASCLGMGQRAGRRAPGGCHPPRAPRAGRHRLFEVATALHPCGLSSPHPQP